MGSSSSILYFFSPINKKIILEFYKANGWMAYVRKRCDQELGCFEINNISAELFENTTRAYVGSAFFTINRSSKPTTLSQYSTKIMSVSFLQSKLAFQSGRHSFWGEISEIMGLGNRICWKKCRYINIKSAQYFWRKSSSSPLFSVSHFKSKFYP